MNIYVRYFDHECVFATSEEVINYLVSINDFNMTQQLRQEITSYIEGHMPYPKRVKVRNNVYFILIKTTAATLEEFKANRKNADVSMASIENSKKEAKNAELRENKVGWYHGAINFKRVTIMPITQKCQYNDTKFSAFVYAESPISCYDQIIEHLRNRQDVDPRSQFPSARGENFKYEFLGNTAIAKE